MAETFVTLLFFYDSPFFGNLIPRSMQNSMALVTLFKYFYSLGLVPFLTLRIMEDAFTVMGYHFILGPFAFTEYVNSISVNKTRACRNLNACVKKYKQISTLVNEFNGIFCFRMFIKTVFPGYVVGIICIFTIVSLHSTMNASMTIILTALTLVIYLTVELLLTLCACLWSKSTHFLEAFSAMECYKVNRAYKKRLMRSLMPIRIKLGESNFVEKSTPLIILSLCFEQTATLLCLRRRK